MKTQFWFAVGLAVVVLLVLTGCEAKLKVESKPNEPNEPTKITVSRVTDMTVAETCYDGVVYLVNSRGGMTAKIDRSSLGMSAGVVPSPFVKCD